MHRSSRILLGLLLAFGLVASACGGAETAVEQTGAANEQLVDEFPTIDGEAIDLASLQGEDVVLWFWAPW